MSGQVLKERLRSAPLPGDEEHARRLQADFFEQLSGRDEWSGVVDEIKSNPVLENLLLGIFGNSSYLSALITRHPEHFISAMNADPETYMDVLAHDLNQQMKGCDTQDQAMQALRVFKQRAALFIALADLSETWDIEKVIHAVTVTADTSLHEAVEFLLKQAAIKGDYLPKDYEHLSADSGYIVLAMGKQGAYELNYSSDVDLIVFFDADRLRLKEGIEPVSFFVKFTRKLVKIMQEMTGDGYVFRMDLRLRPDPGATQIALSTNAAFAYYESFGQNWERAAMIKARPVAGDLQAGEDFLQDLAPFIWRKYLDFAAIDDIHAMKRQIHSFKGHGSIAIEGHNLKLGRGGIREIEFFAQTQQLIAGGRQPELRSQKTLVTLELLAKNEWIKPRACKQMSQAYKFLRRIEHRIQMIADEQTHSLPNDEVGMNRIAKFSGYETIDDFSKALREQLETVQSHYEDLFEGDDTLASACGNLVFVGDTPDPDTIETLKTLGFKEPVSVIDTVKAWHFGRYAATRSERARERLTEFQPLLLDAIAKTSQPDYALATFDRFLKSLPAGIQLFSLLSSNPNLLRLIAEIMGAAPSLARVLSRRPHVLDAVLDPGFFGDLPSDDELRTIIEQEFSHCQDYQDTLDRSRVVGQEQAFLTGVRLLSGVLDETQAARGYTRLAESIIGQLQAQVEQEMVEKHGHFEGAGVSVLAMGKLGGREMTAASDLDLILIYDTDKNQLQSNGKKPLSATQYYSRFTQRLISALSSPTAEGELYEVDMRLRPSGRSGPVATHVESFIDYQHNQAWVWEHMALTRARPITGEQGLKDRLEEAIKDVLSKTRDKSALVKDIVEMRQKIEAEKGTQNVWDLKQVRGGLVDLEFICQFLQLYYGPSHLDILSTNTIDCLKRVKAANIISSGASEQLLDAGHLYNKLVQLIRLCTDQGFDPETASGGLKQRLVDSTSQASFSALTDKLMTSQMDVKSLYDEFLQ